MKVTLSYKYRLVARYINVVVVVIIIIVVVSCNVLTVCVTRDKTNFTDFR